MVFGCCSSSSSADAVHKTPGGQSPASPGAGADAGGAAGAGGQSKILTEPHKFESSKPRMSSLSIVGDTTPTSVKLWIKVPNGGAWTVALSEHNFNEGPAGEDLSNMENKSVDEYLTSKLGAGGLGNGGYVAKTVSLDVTDEHNTGKLTHCFHFTGLNPDTRYYYLVAAEPDTDAGSDWKRAVIGGSSSANEAAYFKTAKSSYADGITFAGYSCHDPYSWKEGEAYEGIWPTFASLRDTLDLTIGGGDQIYVDSNEVACTDLWTFLRDNKLAMRAKYLAQDGELDEEGIVDYLTRLIRQYYQIYWNYSGIKKVYGRVPSYMVWDDHEIMDGWGSLNTKERVEKLRKKGKVLMDDEKVLTLVDCAWRAAAAAYDEYQHCHNPGPAYLLPPDLNPAAQSVTHGHLNKARCDPKDFAWDFGFNRGDEYRFYVTDMRGGHDCDAEKDRLFGPRQHRRLRKWLDSLGKGAQLEGGGGEGGVEVGSAAKAAFVTIPVPVVHWSSIVEYSQYVVKSLKDDLMDGWGHPTNHNERGKLLKELFDASHSNDIPIVILSGDVHCCSAYVLKDKENYPKARIIQITSSAVSRKPVPSAGTIAFAKTGLMTRRKDDGKGKEVKTSVHCDQRFAKAGVVNFVVIGAKEKEISVKFYYHAKGGKLQTAEVDVMS